LFKLGFFYLRFYHWVIVNPPAYYFDKVYPTVNPFSFSD
jgi:hypothetical protein